MSRRIFRPGLSVEEKKKIFFSRVDVKGEDECWEWKGGCSKKYPYCAGGMAYKVCWELHFGELPKFNRQGRKQVVRHLCGNKICVNPNHLTLGTHSDNSNDRYNGGKGLVLTQEDVRVARGLRMHGLPYVEIADMFSVSYATIRYAILGKGNYIYY